MCARKNLDHSGVDSAARRITWGRAAGMHVVPTARPLIKAVDCPLPVRIQCLTSNETVFAILSVQCRIGVGSAIEVILVIRIRFVQLRH